MWEFRQVCQMVTTIIVAATLLLAYIRHKQLHSLYIWSEYYESRLSWDSFIPDGGNVQVLDHISALYMWMIVCNTVAHVSTVVRAPAMSEIWTIQ